MVELPKLNPPVRYDLLIPAEEIEGLRSGAEVVNQGTWRRTLWTTVSGAQYSKITPKGSKLKRTMSNIASNGLRAKWAKKSPAPSIVDGMREKGHRETREAVIYKYLYSRTNRHPQSPGVQSPSDKLFSTPVAVAVKLFKTRKANQNYDHTVDEIKINLHIKAILQARTQDYPFGVPLVLLLAHSWINGSGSPPVLITPFMENGTLYDVVANNGKLWDMDSAHSDDDSGIAMTKSGASNASSSLSMGLVQNGSITPLFRLNVCLAITSALIFLHKECKILHQDLKPENVFIDHAGRAYIGDFGSSLFFGNLPANRMPRVSSWNGTVGYSVPVDTKHQELEHRLCLQIDLYALGIVIFQAITGYQAIYKMSSWSCDYQESKLFNTIRNEVVECNMPGAFINVVYQLAKDPVISGETPRYTAQNAYDDLLAIRNGEYVRRGWATK